MTIIPYLIFSGCLCAFVFSLVLVTSGNNQFANRFLAAIIVALAINLIISWILSNSYFNKYPILHILPYGIGYGLGPLIYFYIKSLTSNDQLNYNHLWWFVGDYVHSMYHWYYGRTFPDHLLHEIVDKFGALSVVVVFCYLWFSKKEIRSYQRELKEKLSNIEQQTLSWINQFFTIFLILMPVAFVLWMLVLLTDLNINNQFLTPTIYLLIIFWLGIGGIRQPEIVVKRSARLISEDDTNQFQKHLEMLVASMEQDKFYLLNDLNVRFLEDQLGLTAKQISEALNKGLGKNFYSFINEYRVNEFKSRIPENPHLTFAGLAKECGFNSKTTFQRVFKEITGMRPSEYLHSR